jgi:inorganic pyrophosphatase
MLYPLDYGYLEGTTSSDGTEIDVWLGSEADHALRGVLLSADLVKHDAEIKLLLGCTEQDIELIADFMRSENSGLLVVKRSVQGKDQI